MLSGTSIALYIDPSIVIPEENATVHIQTGDVMFTHYRDRERHGFPEALSEIYWAYDRYCRPMAPGKMTPVIPNVFAEFVPGSEVYGARHLLDVVRRFLPAGAEEPLPLEPGEDDWMRVVPEAGTYIPAYPDLSAVKGQAGAKRALEIAAAGGHSLLMVGPPGSGKSMLAQRFAGLLPGMSVDEALESAAVSSLAGRFAVDRWGVRPTCAPHHSASAVALVGGGSPPRPGGHERN